MRHSHRLRAFAGLAAALLVGALLGYELWTARARALREAEARTFNYAAITEARLDATLRRIDAILQGLQHEVPLEALEERAQPNFAATVNADLDREMVNLAEVSGLRVYSAEGKLLYTSASESAPRATIIDRTYFKSARDNPEAGLVFSEVLPIMSTGRQGVIAARALRDPKGAFRGVAAAIIDLQLFEKLFQTLDLGDSGVMVIRRSDDFSGVVRWPFLAREVNRPLPPGNPVREAMVAGKPFGTLAFPASSDGTFRTYSYRSVAGYPFFVLAALAHDDVLAGWRRHSLAVGAAGLLLLALLAALLAQFWRMAERETRAAAEIRDSEERLRLATAASGIGLYDLDIGSGRARVNAEYARMLGYDPAQFEETNAAWVERLHPDDRERTFASYRDYVEGRSASYVVEFRQRTREGGYLWIESSGTIMQRDPQGHPLRMLGTHLDITERKGTESSLRELNARLGFLLSSSPVTLYTCEGTPPYASTFVSDNLSSMLGYTPAQFLKTTGFWLDHVHPDDRERVLDGMAEVFTHGIHMQGYRFRHQDGSWRDMEDAIVLIRDASGHPIEMIGYFIDITARKRAEDAVQTLNAELEHRVRERTAELEATNRELETFTYSVSHDLKAPLRGIDGYSKLLLLDHASQLDATGVQYLHKVRHAAQQMDQLIGDLLAYSKMERHTLAVAEMPLRQTIDAVLAEFAQEIGAHNPVISVNLACSTIRADRESLGIALRNLIGNALKFSIDAARPEVEIGCSENDAVHLLWVRDNGMGFDMKYHDRIFDIFERLNHGGKFPGTGVGLAMVRRALERIGGRVWAESAPGAGATFYLEFPK